MKQLGKLSLHIFLFTAIALLTAACEDKISETRTYTANVPEYMSYKKLRASVAPTSARPLKKPGKMYRKGSYLFVCEQGEGIHVIDNSDPANPQNITFVIVPGNIDMAIKGNTLYADSYVDLVSLDISDINSIKEVNRVENVFRQYYPDMDAGYPAAQLDASKGVVVGWEVKEITEEFEYERTSPFLSFRSNLMAYDVAMAESAVPTQSNVQGGSMARFIAYDNYLYLLDVDIAQMFMFDITHEQKPVKSDSIWINWSAETVFINQKKLFVGTQSGMIIYDLSNPAQPEEISSLSHVTACDPVVVQGDMAYVTLRAGQSCGGTVNQLDVIDISNIYQPKLIASYEMTEPYGLGIDNELLFVCDGNAGLKVYNSSNPLTIDQNQIACFDNIHAYDIIPYNRILMLIGNDGFYQYSYADPTSLEYLSCIKVNHP